MRFPNQRLAVSMSVRQLMPDMADSRLAGPERARSETCRWFGVQRLAGFDPTTPYPRAVPFLDSGHIL